MKPHSVSTKHRADIDGLRAFAVAAVVLYHAAPARLPGGYVGVDIFFVISGFLITGLIVDDMDRGRFSLGEFWLRRSRRLLPALYGACLGSLLLGLFVLGADELRTLAMAVLATIGMVSNGFFWAHSGYFAAPAQEQPLLHTWSLGVEEQFYLLYPLALLGLRPLRRHWRLLLGAAAAMSLCLGILATFTRPGFAFYMLPTRAWELLCGAMLALVPAAVDSRGLREAVATLGFAAILAPLVLFDGTTPFPGYAAAVPVAGTMALLWTARSTPTWVAQLLARAPLVAIGRVSYSLYLWHWPLFTFARLVVDRALRPGETLVVLAASAVLAALSWRYLELPFRTGERWRSRRAWLPVAGAAGIAVGAIALAVVASGGFPSRLPPSALTFEAGARDVDVRLDRCRHAPPQVVDTATLCRVGAAGTAAPPVLVWGDSHAASLLPAVDVAAREAGASALIASYSGCPPLGRVGIPRQYGGSHCRVFNDDVLRAVERLGVRRVVLVAYWNSYLEPLTRGPVGSVFDPAPTANVIAKGGLEENVVVLARGLDSTVESLRRRGVAVWILRQIPRQDHTVPAQLSRVAFHGGDADAIGVTTARHRLEQRLVDRALGSPSRPGVRFITPADVLCSPGGICAASRNGQALYVDDNHLSCAGAQLLAPLLGDVFRR